MSIADKLTTIAENQKKVYDKGYTNGRNTMISRSLKTIDDAELTTIGNYAFAGMGLASINLPNVTKASKYSFKGCTGLKEIDLPNLVWLNGKGECTFANCGQVTRYNLPKLRTDSAYSSYNELKQTFASNYVLERLELKNDIAIGTRCFYNCPKLETLILGDNAILNSTDAFESSPIKNGYGYIYVPDDKVDAYKTATNWVVFASQIKGYSELPTEMNTLIFTVNDVEYTAPVGTWENFINSEYNDGVFVALEINGETYVAVDDLTLFFGSNPVNVTDNINTDHIYTLIEYGGEL